MAAVIERPPGGFGSMQEGVRYKSPIHVLPASPDLYVPFETVRTEPQEYEHPLQARIDAELMPLLGTDFTNMDALQAFDQRAAVFGDLIRRLTPDQRNGNLYEDTRKLVERRASCLRIAATVLATKFRYDLHGSIDAKMTDRMGVKKYHSQAVTELRVYGPPPTPESPNPQPLDGPMAMAYLKDGYDEVTDTQSYQIRWLPIPFREQAARIPTKNFKNLYQQLANEWQASAFGSDLVPEQRVANVIVPEIGETDEVMREFKDMTTDQVNALSSGNPQHAQQIADIGAELTDVMIGVDCYLASIGTEVDDADKAAMDQAVKTFAEGPDLEDEGIEFRERMKYLEELTRRRKANLTLPWKPTRRRGEPIMVYTSSRKRRAN